MNVVGVILAAGFGTRLRPSTEYCPKPLIPVGGVEPLFHAIYQMQALGLKDVVVNAHYLPERILLALKSWATLFPNLNLHLCVEKEKILGTGGALLNIMQQHSELFHNKGMLVLNGDTLAHFALEDFVKQSLQNQKSGFAFSTMPLHLERYKPLWIDAKNTWTGIGPKPPSQDSSAVHFLGVHLLLAEDVESLLKGNTAEVREVDLFNGLYRPLADCGRSPKGSCMMGETKASQYDENSFWFDMTNCEFLLEAQRHVMKKLEDSTHWVRVLKARYPNIVQREPGVWVDSENQASIEFVSPVVYVDRPQSQGARNLAPMEIGPNVSLICGDKAILDTAPARKNKIKIKNSVVLVAMNESHHESICDVSNEIRIL